MFKRLLLAAVLAVSATGVAAEGRVTLGWGRIFTNDQIGDSKDRWRSGSYTVSRVRGPSWHGYEALAFGDLLEFRGHAAVIAPDNLTAPAVGDRRYAGLLSLGMNTHFGWKAAEVGLGAELAMTGPRTGIGSFQRWFHELAGMVPPSAGTLGNQIGNHLYPGLNAEIGRSYDLGGLRARPFAEARVGVESLVRVGADFTFGALGRDDLMLRDVTTGLRYRGVAGRRDEGLSLTVGGDLAHVFDTALLPSGGAAVAEDARYRLRAGVQWQGKRAAAFYGVSYLSREFTGQPEGQLVGALSLNLRF
ncbi:lipid A-modifier LpxR family protein [Tabrizicola oligotrophica]|uniref:Lipid A deacylase LpxR family protein n=1 Tax=Tabrizicola oligotrophica TaxID=2710650 RepID=A0A6M0QVN3_9RHOB|nr:lipid A-modifier LpxR family protein [Tabrizicola oligotrophica]NEY91489.1 lipid A deacylase LpxR family protein [Tabrizicola oligotrophica]